MRSLLNRLFAGESLSRLEAKSFMDKLLLGSYPDVHIASALACFRMRLPTSQELMGFRESLLNKAHQINLNQGDTIDMVGTGGDGKDTFNITTISALTVAACGYKVVKHGNGSATSKHGSSDTLKAAGFSFRKNKDQLQKQLDSANITFLHAPLFHPSLGKIAALRKALGYATVFNLLGPLVNPARPKYNYIGVADARTQGLFADVFSSSSEAYSIVHSNDGYDEATLTGPVRCYSNSGRLTLQAREFGLGPTTHESIRVANDATAQFLSIIKGKGTAAETATVATNAALAIQLRKPEKSLEDLAVFAIETLRSGKVFDNFKKLCAA